MSELTLFDTIAKVLKVAPETISIDSSPKTLAQWDSMAQVALILELESVFGVRFHADDIVALDSTMKIRDALEKMGALK